MTLFSIMILVGFFVLVTGFFSGSETALISINRIKLRHLAESGNRNAKIIQHLLGEPDQLFITLLIGTNLAIIFASSIFSSYWVTQGNPFAEELTILLITPLVLIFGEIIPKALFRHNAFFLATSLAPLLRLSFKTFFPFARILRFLNDTLLRLMGQKRMGNEPLFVTKAELKYIIQESEQKGLLKAHERSMIYRIFELGEESIKKIMTPLEHIVALEASATIAEMVSELRKSRFSWVPVFQEAPHQFIGFVSLFDVAYEEDVEKPLSAFLRPLVSVNEAMALDEVLLTLQRGKSSMAIVEDSKRKALGLVTIEDLLGELVGGT